MSESAAGVDLDQRVLIFAPVGKDAPLALDVLARTHVQAHVCRTSAALCTELGRGASVILLTEEALEDPGIGNLMDALRGQPAWSDIPILLFADAERSEIYLRTLRLLEGLRNVILLERPIRLGAVLSLVRSAMRGRQRQYELRNLLRALADAREEAESANRLKDEFLATLSHELRTPLNAILGWTTMLRDGHVQPRQVQRALDTIHRNASAQVQIVNDLLDISRIVQGKVQLSPRRLSLEPLLRLAVESILPTAEAKGVTIATTFPATPVFVWGDTDRLQQVCWNILTNAVKFTARGGHVTLDLTADDGEACIRVSDTGVGIPAAFLPHVFERFRQADGSATRVHGGLGLGLSIVRHLVELHGGRMSADSEGEGRGATFSIYLPISRPDRAPVPPTVPDAWPADGPPDLRGLRVLIVDDEQDARELLRAMLVDTGAEVVQSESADGAVEAIAARCPDLLLADVAMPKRDGYDMIREIRERDGARHRIGSIAVSAYARPEERERAIGAGFDEHVAKPVQRDELYHAIRRVAGGRPPGRAVEY